MGVQIFLNRLGQNGNRPDSGGSPPPLHVGSAKTRQNPKFSQLPKFQHFLKLFFRGYFSLAMKTQKIPPKKVGKIVPHFYFFTSSWFLDPLPPRVVGVSFFSAEGTIFTPSVRSGCPQTAKSIYPNGSKFSPAP